MITKRLSGLLAVAMLLLASCGKKNPSYTKYISKDANYVIGIDVRSILEKLDKDSLSVEKIMTTFKEETSNEKFTKALSTYSEFKDAGIDWTSRVYIAASLSGSMMGGGGFGGNVEAVAGLKDAKKFEEFLKKQPDTKDIKKGDGFSYTGDADRTIGWNDDAVIIVSSQSSNSYDDYMPDSLGGMSKPQSASNATAAADQLKKLFKQDKKESIAEAEGFSDLQSEKGDVVIYSQSGNLAKSFPFLSMMPKLGDFLKGYSTSSLNFENGKVVTESTGHLGKEATDFLKKYAGPNIDWSLVENYASNNVDGVVAFSFKPELIPGLVQYLGFEGPAAAGLQQAGLTLEETGKIFKGDFAVVVSDFAVAQTAVQPGKDDMSSASNVMPTAKMVFVAKLGDKAVVEKLLKLATDRGLIVRNGNMIAPNPQMSGGAPFPYAISIANDQLTFASDAATLTAYQAKSGKITLPSGVESTLKGNAAGAYVDVQKILNGVSPTLFQADDADGKAIFDQAKATFKDGWYTFSNLSGSTITSKAEFNMVSDKQNSLSQIIKFGLFAYEQTKASRAARKAEMDAMPVDTTGPMTAPMISADSAQ